MALRTVLKDIANESALKVAFWIWYDKLIITECVLVKFSYLWYAVRIIIYCRHACEVKCKPSSQAGTSAVKNWDIL